MEPTPVGSNSKLNGAYYFFHAHALYLKYSHTTVGCYIKRAVSTECDISKAIMGKIQLS